MTEQSRAESMPDAENTYSAAGERSGSRAADRKRCAHCGGPFGMVRRRRAGKHFCSAVCIDGYDHALRQAAQDRTRWHAFLAPKRTSGEG